MSKCSVIGCTSKKGSNPKTITFHRLPKNEIKKNKWLESIGPSNVRLNNDHVFLCSLHFEQSSINKTLHVAKLRDEALPMNYLVPSAAPRYNIVSNENKDELMLTITPLQTKADSTLPSAPPCTVERLTEIKKKEKVSPTFTTPLENEAAFTLNLLQRKIRALRNTCQRQKKIIRALKETVRRRDRKIDSLENGNKNDYYVLIVNKDTT